MTSYPYGGSWTCGKCGSHVPAGWSHACNPSLAYTPTPPPHRTLQDDILEALLRIEALLRQITEERDDASDVSVSSFGQTNKAHLAGLRRETLRSQIRR